MRFHREIGSEQEKHFGRVMYASETIQNCKNPTGHIDTLKLFWLKWGTEFCFFLEEESM